MECKLLDKEVVVEANEDLTYNAETLEDILIKRGVELISKEDIEKMNKVIDRQFPEAARETLLVLDATTGQNALNQAKLFKEAAGLDGIILTKLDGTAKGGVVIGISDQFQIPVKFIGVGEKIEDLQIFNKREFVASLFKK